VYLPVVWLHVVYDELVVALGGEVERGSDDADGRQEEDGPGRGNEVEAGVEMPVLPEMGVVVVQVGLVVSILASHKGGNKENGQGHTTIAIPAH
jgi:hypothetical protein